MFQREFFSQTPLSLPTTSRRIVSAQFITAPAKISSEQLRASIAQRSTVHFSVRSYKKVMRALKDGAEMLHLNLAPKTITTDFEVGLMAAVANEFANAGLHGCLFHFCQAIWRKIQFLGLSQLYGNDDAFLMWCRQRMALPFLPVDDVPNAFAFVEQTLLDNVEENAVADLLELKKQLIGTCLSPAGIDQCRKQYRHGV